MAKAQGKKAAAEGKSAAKKITARAKSAVKTVAKKIVAKMPAAPPKAVAKKPAPKPAAKPATPAKPVKKAGEKVKQAAKQVAKVAKAAPKAVAKAAPKAIAKAAPKAAVVKAAPKAIVKAVPKAVAKVAPKVAPKAAAAAANKGKAAPAVVPSISKPVAVPPVKPLAPVAPKAPEPEKKRGRRARTRITSSGAPAAMWLSTEKPRPASFIPAPPRAEAPSAIAAPPASSDRLIRPEDLIYLAVRTVPVRIDIEQGAGRFYLMAYPLEVTLKVGEGIEWDFRYIGGADVTADEVVIEFDRPSPFPQIVYRTRKPGGARPHRQLSGGATAAAAGKRVQYTVRAMTAFKTEMASAKIWVNITQ